jgi:all-trans-nonaprenyl-diphosphate synthase
MMSVTSKSIDFFGKNNLVSCGCSSNASFHRYKVKNFAKVNSKVCGNGARKLVCCKKRNTPKYSVSSMETAEPTLNGISILHFFYKYNCVVELLHITSLN